MRGIGERGTRPVPRMVATTTNHDEETDTGPEPSVAAEVIALSPRTLPAATSRFACEACGKAFLMSEQSQQLHRRGHAHGEGRLPRDSGRPAYVCPEASRARHEPGEVAAGIGRHNRRRHGERKWKCDLCGKRYAVDYDWEAHARVCGVGNKQALRRPPQSWW